MTKIWDFLYEDTQTGEQFFVETETKARAWEIVKDNFGDYAILNIKYINRFTPAEAEWMGYDTY